MSCPDATPGVRQRTGRTRTGCARRARDGALYAWWLEKSGADTYAYDVRLASSTDQGAKPRSALAGIGEHHGRLAVAHIDTDDQPRAAEASADGRHQTHWPLRENRDAAADVDVR